MLIWVIFKKYICKIFSLALVGFELTLLACYKEINNTEANTRGPF